jgi:hypothetical protein
MSELADRIVIKFPISLSQTFSIIIGVIKKFLSPADSSFVPSLHSLAAAERMEL